MPENELCPSKDRPRTPWNKGKLIGAKPTAAKACLVHQDPVDGWVAPETSPCSIWRSTASYAVAT